MEERIGEFEDKLQKLSSLRNRKKVKIIMNKSFETCGTISIGLTCISLDFQKEKREVQNKYANNGQILPIFGKRQNF